MNDLTEFSEKELSLVVNNDEFLYRKRFILNKELLHELGLKFTDEQWQVFQDDLEEEEDE